MRLESKLEYYTLKVSLPSQYYVEKSLDGLLEHEARDDGRDFLEKGKDL